MGKPNKKSKGASQGQSKSGNQVPSFDEKALASLTEKLEQSIGGGQPTEPSEKTPKSAKSKKPKDGSKSKPQLEEGRGTKRDRKGNAKETTGESKDKKPSKGADDREAMLQEILALGGTEEDLDLVAGAESESEPEDSAPLDKSLKKDLARFIAGLGIEGNFEAAEAEDSEAVDEAEEEWEEAPEEESEEEEDEPEPAVKSKPAKKNAAKLVAAQPEVATPAVEHNDPNRLVFEARPDWHALPLADLPKGDISESSPYRESIQNLKDYAISLLDADNALYSSKHLSQSSSHRFLSTIMTSGTLSDKVSALTLVVQESPVHTVKSFENIIALAKKRSRGQAVTALGALKDLLGVGVVLPADRRLRHFASQPGLLGILQESDISVWKSGQPLPGNISKAHLISWAYEDWLKEQYFDMLKVLEGWCNDEIEYARGRAVTYVYELLRDKPEQESNLLRLLVNKLGDPEKKIASRTSYLLLQLQTSHPAMKPIIIRSIENELLLRPNQTSTGRYYAINTLNQTILSAREEEVAQKLLSIYFELFVSLLKKPEAAPRPTGPALNKKGQVQGGGAPMGKAALEKAAKEEAKAASEETTEKMISAVLTGVNRAFPFSKNDDSTLEKHMDTLFKITHSSNFNTSIQALMLIEQLSTQKHLAVDRFYRTLYESLLDPRLVTSSKHALYLNLLYRALGADVNIKRVKAFAKRLLQIVTLHQPSFICGVLYLLRELEIKFPGLKSMFNDPEQKDEDDEEVFRDVPEDGEDLPIEKPAQSHKPPTEIYDGRKRDPEYSNAEKSCLWESIPFLAHFHPSVALFADRLMSDQKMPPKPDLTSHTLTHFLDRFVYRNAKASAGGPKGSSIMQPLAGGDSKGILLSNRTGKAGQYSVNSEAFWRKKADEVAVDEVFFHKYFSQIGKGKQPAVSKTKAAKGPDDEDNEEDENEDEIWQALVDSRPEVEGPSDDDSDLEMMDLDSDDMMSSDEGEEDGGVIINEDDDEDAEDSEEALSDEEDGDLVGSESDAGSELDALFEKEMQAGGATEESEKPETSRQKKRKMKSLPTFASADDYAAMLDNDEDEDLE